jgi:hypothetical protein
MAAANFTAPLWKFARLADAYPKITPAPAKSGPLSSKNPEN